MPTDTSPKYLTAPERRAVTVEAVVALAATQNPTDITTAAIAKHMGLTQGAIFRHFPSKESIVQSVIDWVSEKLMARVAQAAQSQKSPLQSLNAVFLAHIGFIAAHPGAPRMLLSELQKGEDTIAKRMVLTLLTNYRLKIIALLQAGKEAGEVDPELNLEAASTLYVGMVQGLAMQLTAQPGTSQLLADAGRVFDIFKRGLVCNN